MPEIRVIEAKIPTQGKLRVAAYCRVSSDSADQLASYRNQVNHYTGFIGETPEWELAGIYADEGLTGTRADTRDDFQRMLRDCARGKIDRILVKSISRFSRNTRDCLAAVRQLRLMGVSVYFEKEKIDTAGMNGEMLLSMYSASAQQESVSISQNLRWGYKRRMERGDFITSVAPYGYRLKDKTLHIHEPESEIVRRIFREYLSGKSKQQIADSLNADNIPKGTPWNVCYISYMLANEKYAGEVILQKRYTTDTLPFKRMTNHGEVTRYRVQNSHPPIISAEDFYKARKLAQRRDISKSEPVPYPFSRRIFCANCGHALKRRVQNGKVRWTCYTHRQNRELCPTPPVYEPDIKSAFTHMWNKLMQNCGYILAPLLTDLRELNDNAGADSVLLGEVNRQIAEFTEQNIILNQIHVKGYLDDALFIQQTDELSRKINTLRAERRNLLKRDEDDPTLMGIQILSNIMDEAKTLTEFDEDAFTAIIDKIIIENDKKLRFRLKGGLEFSEFLKKSGVSHD